MHKETVRQEFNMACPTCGNDDKLQVVINVWADLRPYGTVLVDNEHEWDSQSSCACFQCGWSGTVGDAHVDGPATADQELNAKRGQ